MGVKIPNGHGLNISGGYPNQIISDDRGNEVHTGYPVKIRGTLKGRHNGPFKMEALIDELYANFNGGDTTWELIGPGYEIEFEEVELENVVNSPGKA